MSEAGPGAAGEAAFPPSPLRVGAFFAWTWRLFRDAFPALATVFIGTVLLVRLLHFGVLLFLTGVLDAEGTVEGLAISLASVVVLSTVFGSLVSGIASFVFLQRLAGVEARSGGGWRRLRPKFGHVVVAALYVSMPLLALLLFLGPIVQYVLLPALLGPPILVQAIVWEHRDFRDAATRAKNLLAGAWGRVISTLLLVALGAALVQIVVLAAAASLIPGAEDGSLVPSLWFLLFEVIASGIAWFFTSAASTVAYLDARSRFEELDREALSAEAVERPV